MKPPFLLAAALSLASLSPAIATDDWPWWRGPHRNGVADSRQPPPVAFGPEKNVKWSVDLPGRAHGSATVVGDRVFIASAEESEQIQALHAFDRQTGKELWKTAVHRGGFTQKSNKKASWASGSPACDGERVFINFINEDAVFTTALSVTDGSQLWQTKITGYTIHQGYGSSPALWEHLVIVSADNKSGGAIAGLNRQTGEVIWKVERAPLPNYPSPIILEAAGKPQLFMTGTDKVTSLDPLTGRKLWEIDGATTECVTSTVTDGRHLYSSGGYPTNHVAAIAADGSGKIVWQTNDRVYVPSMLIHDDHLYAVMDSGVAICWDSATGEEKWKARLGGNFTASPVLVGEHIYAANESGTLFVFTASPDGLRVLAENTLGDEIYASPAICGGEIFLRVADFQGETRSERLVCYAAD